MTAEALISRLDGAKRTGPGRWLARCPAHPDKSPSLSVRELDDGRVLVHDFGGCDVGSVLDAVGLTFDDLFPERPIENGKPERRPFFKSDVYDVARHEITIVYLIGADLQRKKAVCDEDYRRLGEAVRRLENIAEIAYGPR